jgi:hypothetical protein
VDNIVIWKTGMQKNVGALVFSGAAMSWAWRKSCRKSNSGKKLNTAFEGLSVVGFSSVWFSFFIRRFRRF